jgi:hypothetical protein
MIEILWDAPGRPGTCAATSCVVLTVRSPSSGVPEVTLPLQGLDESAMGG